MHILLEPLWPTQRRCKPGKIVSHYTDTLGQSPPADPDLALYNPHLRNSPLYSLLRYTVDLKHGTHPGPSTPLLYMIHAVPSSTHIRSRLVVSLVFSFSFLKQCRERPLR